MWCYYQFQVSISGYSGVSLTWDQTSSNTGPRDFKLQYSTNGSTFTDFGNYTVQANGLSPNAAWNGTTPSAAYNLSFDLTSITALGNQATAFFRLVDNSTVAVNSPNPVASTGTNRVDNFTVNAAPVPIPPALGLMAAGLGLLGGVARKRKS